jgi:hypothetical protein
LAKTVFGVERTMMRKALYVVVMTLSSLSGCARRTGSASTPGERSDLITHDQIANVGGARNLYDVVERLRPRWLVVRSGMRSFSTETVVAVFQGQLFLGTQDALRNFGTEGVYEIQYLDGATAKATLPGIADRHVQGAIVVHMTPP